MHKISQTNLTTFFYYDDTTLLINNHKQNHEIRIHYQKIER